MTKRWAATPGGGFVRVTSALAAALVGLVGGEAAAQVAPPAPEAVEIGEWSLTPRAEVRARGEYRYDLDQEDHGLLVERTRLGLDALRGPLEARVVLQDARALDLGARQDPIVGPGSLSVTGAFEGWVEAHTDGSRPSFVRLGRQPVTWGEGRLLSEADWSPTGRSLDAVRGRLVARDAAFEVLGAALTDPQDSAGIDAYGELGGARAEWAIDPLFAAEAYVLVRVAQQNPVASLGGSVKGETYTGALRLHGDSRGWKWGAEGAYQLGHATDLHADRAAWAAAGHVAYTLESVTLQPSLQVGGAYASGDTGGATYRTFDPLLPDVHKWHGAMDLFAWSNEAEVNARVQIVPAADTLVRVEWRYARLAQPGDAWRDAYLATIGVAARNTDANLGNEIDAMVRWSPWEPLDLEAGYSILLLGDGARAILAANAVGASRGANPSLSTETLSHFAYGQATLRLP